MATYHFDLKTFKRSKGKSAVAAAAYQSGEKLFCHREGRTKYPRRNAADVVFTGLLGWNGTRSGLWSSAELAELRKNSVVARGILLALPKELSHERRIQLAVSFGKVIAEQYNVAVDIAVHRPRSGDGQNENHHGHLLFTTREVIGGQLQRKTRILDDRQRGSVEIKWMREKWEDLVNQALERAGFTDRVSCKKTKDPLPKLLLSEAAWLRKQKKNQPVSKTLKQLKAASKKKKNLDMEM
jgi:hypothetical protein